jgi:hypothetical protein
VRPLDRNAEVLLQLRRAAGVVDMAVGQQDLLDRDAGLLNRAEDARKIAAGIDHGAALRRVVEDERTVLLKERDRNDGGTKRHRAARNEARPDLRACRACQRT